MHAIAMINLFCRLCVPEEMFIYSFNFVLVLAIRLFGGCFSGLAYQGRGRSQHLVKIDFINPHIFTSTASSEKKKL